MKQKGKTHHGSDKKLHKAKSLPQAYTTNEGQMPQAPKPGTNAQNQFR
jgi:hypothetical protein